MSKKRKQPQTVVKLSEHHSLTFITTRDLTVCVCEPIFYDKIVARHTGCRDLEAKHEGLRSLFDQYVEDAKRALMV